MSLKLASPESLTSFDDRQWRFFLFRQTPWKRKASAGTTSFGTLERPLKSIVSYVGGFAIILLVTFFYAREVSVSTTTVGFTFLLVILSASAVWGLGVSCMMSVAATLAFDYFFLPPIGSLDVANPQDWVIGSVGIAGPPVSQGTMDALGSLVAAAIERAGAIEHATKMEAARQSEQFKSVMLDAIAHDFRTPLTGIKTSVTALLTELEFEGEQKKELLTIIDEECDRIDQLLDKASEMARLKSGDAKLPIAPHEIGEIVSTALADCKRVSRVRPIHREVEHGELVVLADLSWTRSVLVQLIVNTHLNTWPGQPITISSERRGEFALIHVADQGPGIDKAELVRIFEKFYRCKDQQVRAQGTGMGLPIARAIVEAPGGTLDVVSRFGQGSIFTFSLPLDPCSEANSEGSRLD